jgi:M3 family oligoendopeptidase
MKFSQFEYKRPELESYSSKFREKLDRFNNAGDFKEQEKVLKELLELRNEYYSMKELAFIKYSINTGDEEFVKEQDFFDENSPLFGELFEDLYRSLINSKFKKETEDKYGKMIFNHAELSLKTFDPAIIEDLKEENHLSSKYMKLKASAKIMFEGVERNLPGLQPFMESEDRDMRKKATEAYWSHFEKNAEEFDKVFDDLVKLRNKMAMKLGYKNFIELGYARMKRMDFNSGMVKTFRDEIKKYIVPLTVKLREEQCKRLGIDKVTIYDKDILFKSGNAKPKGSPEWIVKNGEKMYNELSRDTGEFFNFMVENELLDLYMRNGKADMGYCDYIPKYRSPFIFANFNGTEGDITVLTHEAGHAFQSYKSRDLAFLEYQEGTSETAEIHSMSMEFLTWPWMEMFFKEDTDKFKYVHVTGCIFFLPYGALVDEFQHWIYENPDVSPSERKMKWLELENEYIPGIDYKGIKHLEDGGKWQRQGHIYEMPFYYIDYCLAQIVAFQFLQKGVLAENGIKEKTLNDYIKLCETGGSISFLGLLEMINMNSPFDEGMLKPLVDDITGLLESIEINE